MKLTTTQRETIRAKFGGKCAYCGKPLPTKGWHADHVIRVLRGWSIEDREKAKAGPDEIANLFPSCARCNLRKSGLTLQEFRSEIEAQVKRLRRDSAAFVLAEDFGQVVADPPIPVQFWFETYTTTTETRAL